MYNFLKYNILKNAETIQKVTIFMQKKQEYRGLNFQAQHIFFGMDSKILEVF